MRRFALISILALTAAACGGGGSAVELDSGAVTTTTLETTDAEGASQSLPQASSSTSTAPEASEASDSETAGPDPGAVPDSDYPDIVVADLAGGEVNLRTLALEENPVLLWFWAPH